VVGVEVVQAVVGRVGVAGGAHGYGLPGDGIRYTLDDVERLINSITEIGKPPPQTTIKGKQ
jgi:hypothetical protein